MGTLRRELGRTLAIFSMPLLLCGCELVFGLALCNALCGEEEVVPGAIVLTILSPAEFDPFEAAPVTITFAVDHNVGGVTVAANAGAEDVGVVLPAGVLTAELTVVVAQPSGLARIGVSAWSNADPSDITSVYRMITWAAPWEATILSCGALSCAPLAADATLSGDENLAIVPTWDDSRLASVELTLDGVAPEDLDPVSNNVRFDVDPMIDGPVTLAFTAVRDDGERATVTRTIEILNCARARPNALYHVGAYTTDGLLITADMDGSVNVLEARDLHDEASISSSDLGAGVTALALDDANRVAYLGLWTGGGTYRIGAISYDPPGAEISLDTTAEARSITVGPDGAVYWTEGARFAAPVGAVWRKVPGAVAASARVDVGGLPGADGLVFDDDGTLLIAAGTSIVRLTLTAGVETTRTTVLTRAGASFSLLALDDLGRLYVTDLRQGGGELLRYTGTVAELLYTQPEWAAGGMEEPWGMSFVEYPPRCHGLLITRPGLDDARRMVDVGEVRGRP